jgi:hypothetical protein
MEKNGKMPGGLDGDTSLNLDEKNISTIENVATMSCAMSGSAIPGSS